MGEDLGVVLIFEAVVTVLDPLRAGARILVVDFHKVLLTASVVDGLCGGLCRRPLEAVVFALLRGVLPELDFAFALKLAVAWRDLVLLTA